MSVIHKTPGTYILMLELFNRSDVEIGRTCKADLNRGLYCYVGSALGPGGLAARLRRHASVSGRKHWHIDYLVPHTQLTGALVIEDTRRHECTWAAWLSRVATSCVDGFGASDCRCKGHLFYLGLVLDQGQFFVEQAQKELHAQYMPKEALMRLTA